MQGTDEWLGRAEARPVMDTGSESLPTGMNSALSIRPFCLLEDPGTSLLHLWRRLGWSYLPTSVKGQAGQGNQAAAQAAGIPSRFLTYPSTQISVLPHEVSHNQDQGGASKGGKEKFDTSWGHRCPPEMLKARLSGRS